MWREVLQFIALFESICRVKRHVLSYSLTQIVSLFLVFDKIKLRVLFNVLIHRML